MIQVNAESRKMLLLLLQSVNFQAVFSPRNWLPKVHKNMTLPKTMRPLEPINLYVVVYYGRHLALSIASECTFVIKQQIVNKTLQKANMDP